MAAVLRRIFTAVMCFGIALSAADAHGLICEYACGSGHARETGELNAAEVGSMHLPHSTITGSLPSVGSPDSDSDCSSLNVLVVATGTAPDVSAPDNASIGIIDAESYAMPDHRYRATAIAGSPPLGADCSFPGIPVSLRI